MEKINLVLPVNAVNAILAALGTRPFSEVAGLIMEIKQQAEPQVQKPEIEIKPEVSE